MGDAHHFLENLALVLCVAAVTTVLFQRLRQPVVLGYLLAGLIIGPHLPVPLIADQGMVHALSETGVILLMFSIGLEFSLRKLASVGPTAGVVAVIQVSIMLWLGYAVGRLFGWTVIESVFMGAIISISSTTIIAKAFEEQHIGGKLRELVFGILIVEDLLAILLLATLTTVATGSGLSPKALALTAGRLAAFLAALLAVGLLVIPRAVRAIVRLDRPETTLVASIGICFAISLLAHKLGYSVALGAFIAGSLVAESGEAKKVEHLVEPVRNMFAAIFFVAVGMLIDPALIARHWAAVLILTAVVMIGKVASVTLGGLVAGQGTRTSVKAGMSLAQIGEFSFIIAGLGLTLGATGDFMYPVAVAVSCLTTLFTPWLIRAAEPLAASVDRRLPAPLQTLIGLYSTWLEGLRSSRREKAAQARIYRLLRLMIVDAACIALLVIGASLSMSWIVAVVTAKIGMNPEGARTAVLFAAGALCLPFVAGIVRSARSFGLALAADALPAASPGKLDLAAAPRKAFVVTLQLASVLLVGLALLAVTQPFLPPFRGALLFVPLLVVLGVAFWRSATSLEGHVRAGAQVIIEAIAAEARAEDEQAADSRVLTQIQTMLPGIGATAVVRLSPRSGAVGKTLAQINLRGLTEATVLALTRGGDSGVVPTGREVLEAGDVLALSGTGEAIELAQTLLATEAVQEVGAPSVRAHDGIGSQAG